MLCHRASSVIRARPAFTLLELVIVLVIMVGLTAIAWPNLAKQLRKSELRESAQLLRSAIEECGYRAASDGRPVFLKLVEGSGVIEVIASSDLPQEAASSSSATASDSEFETDSILPPESAVEEAVSSSDGFSTSEASRIRSWEFSGAVVVRSVRWQIESVQPPSEPFLDSDSVSEEAYGYSDPPLAEVDSESNLLGLEETLSSGKVWWMPFVAPSSPSGVGREATIELYDVASEESLRVTYEPASGRVEVLP